MKMFVTYGLGSNQGHNYSTVEGDDYFECRRKVNEVCGQEWGFMYSEEEFAGQPEEYGLTEIPLHPQMMLY